MKDLLLAIDAGGTALKVVLFDAGGTLVAEEEAALETVHHPDGRVERDADGFWGASVEAVRRITARVDPARIAAVGVTGFGNGIFMVDGNGRQTRPGIVSVDQRAKPIVDAIEAGGDARAIEDVTGHRIWGGQTLFQILNAVRAEPAVMERTRWALACKDFLRLRLTGEAFTDPTDASGGGLMNVARGRYAREVFARLGMAGIEEKLPPIAECGAVAGRISPAAAGETGLPAGTPVAGSAMDVAAAALGCGVASGDRIVMIAGTWSINGIESRGPDGARPPVLNMLHRDRSTRFLAEGSPTSASNLAWFMRGAAGGALTVGEVNDLVAAAPVAGRRCQFLPFVMGPRPRMGAFLGLGPADDRGTMLRALFEGVAFQHRVHAEEVLAHDSRALPSAIRLAGGAARSPVWPQVFADACGLPVEVSAAAEVGALGAAICAAVAAGIHPTLTDAVAAMARVGRRFRPDPPAVVALEARYQEFLRLDRRCADLFAEHRDEPGTHRDRQDGAAPAEAVGPRTIT